MCVKPLSYGLQTRLAALVTVTIIIIISHLQLFQFNKNETNVPGQ